MEKRRLGLVLFGAAGIMSVALCSSAAAAVSWQLKLPKGKTYYEKVVVEQHITQTIMNRQQVVDITTGWGKKCEVVGLDRGGNMRIRHTFIWCMLKQTGPTGTVSYDSARQTTPPAGAEPLGALLNQSYTVQVSPKGKVLNVEGVKELKTAVQKRMPPGAQAGPMGNVADPFLEESSVKEMAQTQTAFYPDKPVEQGQSWSGKRVLTSASGMIEDSQYTLQEQEAGVAIIGVKSSFRANPEARPTHTQGMEVRTDLSGTLEGTIRVVEATGLIEMRQVHQQLKGEIKVSGSAAQRLSAMVIPTVADTNSKVETTDKMWETAAP